MSKIICQVCGTAYPETDTQCPICGCVHSGDNKTVNINYTVSEPEKQQNFVKGGRFSKANVKKRQKANQMPAPAEKKPSHRPQKVAAAKPSAENTHYEEESHVEESEDSGRGLLITVIAVMLVIAAAVVFLSVKYLLPALMPDVDTPDDSGSSQQSPQNIPCQQITLSKLQVKLENHGDTFLLTVYTMPSNTTDKVTFTSTNESVATVSADGLITAVGPGQADIVVTCNGHQDICRVSSTAEVPSGSGDTDSDYAFKLNRAEIVFSYEGESWLIYNGEIPQSDIIWTTDSPGVATVVDGNVVAVGEGSTQVHGEYDGVTLSCTIICDFDESSGDGDSGVSEDGTGGAQNKVGIVNVNDALNVRSGPGTEYEAVEMLLNGDRVTITEEKTVNGITWGKVHMWGDYIGWACMDYIIIQD